MSHHDLPPTTDQLEAAERFGVPRERALQMTMRELSGVLREFQRRNAIAAARAMIASRGLEKDAEVYYCLFQTPPRSGQMGFTPILVDMSEVLAITYVSEKDGMVGVRGSKKNRTRVALHCLVRKDRLHSTFGLE